MFLIKKKNKNSLTLKIYLPSIVRAYVNYSSRYILKAYTETLVNYTKYGEDKKVNFLTISRTKEHPYFRPY